MHRLLAPLALLPSLLAPPHAQDNQEVVAGRWHSLESEVLGETRRFIVSTPQGYEGGEGRYVALYLLDGDYHFLHTVGLVEFLVASDLMPPTLVVALANTDRTRDMTPPAENPDPRFAGAGGGAPDFARFFAEELIPHVDANFRTQDYRVLVGHSFGGLFAVHTLVHAPETFDAYVAISPSMQWDEQRLLGQAKEFFRGTPRLDASLYMTTGSEGGELTGGVLELAGALTAHAPEGFEWDSRIMPEETHASVVHRSTRQGLEFVFRHWGLRDAVAVFDTGGVAALHAHFGAAEGRYGIARSLPPTTVMQLSWQLSQEGRLDESLALIEHDPEAYPPNAMLYSMVAAAFREREDTELAIECYLRALELNSADAPSREALLELGLDARDLPEVPALSAAALATYAGRYGPEGSEVTARIEDGQLQLGGSMPKMTLTPVRAHHFAVVGQPYEVSFEVDGAGRVLSLSLALGGEVLESLPRAE